MFRGISFRLVGKLISRTPPTHLIKNIPINSFLSSRTFKYPTSWHAVAKFSTEITKPKAAKQVISGDALDEYIQKVDKESWHNVIDMLEQVACFPKDLLNHEKSAEFFSKVEKRFMEKEQYFLQNHHLVQLGYCFGAQSRGSEAFWGKLMEKFQFLLGNNKLKFEYILRFLTGASSQLMFDQNIWSQLEEVLMRNPQIITPAMIGDALPLLVKTYLKQGQNSAFNIGTEEETEVQDIEDNQLWNSFRRAAMKEVLNMNSSELGNVCWSLSVTKYKEEGFWMLAEQRFHEIKDQIPDHEFAQYAYCFGTAQQGSLDFWQEMEAQVLNNIHNLTGYEIKTYINGFAGAEEGTLRLWNELQKCITNVDLSNDELSSIITGFATYEITNPKTWTYLEEQVFAKLKDMCPGDLSKIIFGLANAERGDKKLWDAIEEKVLNETDLDKHEKVTYYIALKAADRLTTNLASHLDEATNAAESILSHMDDQEGEEDEEEVNQDYNNRQAH